ncbi:hypothetical protein K1719_046279 [Acacia pycnantha]|nr:hypothetical protein K1719_046279 [Acacia pycnantha]
MPKYAFISRRTWREFVASRQNPAFLEISQANTERQTANKYPHFMSRGGYKKLERRLMEEELEKMKEDAKSDPSITVQAPEPPPRYKKWKAARIKDGKYINPDVAEVAAKIMNLRRRAAKVHLREHTDGHIVHGDWKADDLGHVRGEPRGVSAAKYFGRRRRFSYDDENPPPRLVAKIRAQLEDDLLRQLRDDDDTSIG